jgi:hypothetical protein
MISLLADWTVLPPSIIVALLGLLPIIWVLTDKELPLKNWTVPAPPAHALKKLAIAAVAIPFWFIAILLLVPDLESRLVATVFPSPAPTASAIVENAALPKSCAGAKSLRSGESALNTSIHFVNETTAPVQIFWVDRHGKEKPYSRLNPDEQTLQPTFAGDVWIVRTTHGKCVHFVVAGPAPQDDVISG